MSKREPTLEEKQLLILTGYLLRHFDLRSIMLMFAASLEDLIQDPEVSPNAAVVGRYWMDLLDKGLREAKETLEPILTAKVGPEEGR